MQRRAAAKDDAALTGCGDAGPSPALPLLNDAFSIAVVATPWRYACGATTLVIVLLPQDATPPRQPHPVDALVLPLHYIFG